MAPCPQPMRFLRSARSWLFGGATPPVQPRPRKREAAGTDQPGATPAASVSSRAAIAARQERAAERLLEDEALRGDLADEEYRPLLDWALAASDQLVARTASHSDAEADEVVEAGLGQLREVVRTAARAITAMLDDGPEARDAELREIVATVGPPLVQSESVGSSRMTLMAAFDRVADDPSLAGADLGRALADALGRATADAGETARERHAAE